MNRATLILAVAALTLAAGPLALAVEPAEPPIEPKEKIVLFDGRTLDGWFIQGKKETWSVKDGVVDCTGRPSGYIRTVKDYANYKLHVEWRWTDKPGNSGTLVHMSLPDRVWPKSIECQLMNRNAGDFFVIGGTEFTEHKGKRGRRVAKNGPSNEKEPGQWNVYEIICDGDKVLPHVNGKLMNTATDCSVTSGKICLQSEGRPIQFRNVYVEPVDKK